MNDLIDPEGFRANVGIILTRPAAAGDESAGEQGALFLGGRPSGRGWQFPQGGVREGESPEAAVFRELTEEIGLEAEDVELLGSTREWLRYRLPTHYRRRTLPLCVGQKQRWFLLRLKSDEGRIRFDTTDTPEFDRWRWVPYWTPVQEVIYFKRRVYSRALHELGPLIYPNGLPPYPQDWPAELMTPSRASSRRRRRGPRRRR